MDESLLLPPGLVTIPGVSLPMLGRLFTAAAEFYALAPWKVLGSDMPLHVCYPLISRARTVVLMGSAGITYGLCVYDRVDDLPRMLQAPDPLQAAGELSWLALSFETADYLAAEDRQAAQAYGWKVAGELAYPALSRIGPPGPELRSPLLSDLLWLEGALAALNVYFSQPLQPGTTRLAVVTLAGPAEASITLSAPGV